LESKTLLQQIRSNPVTFIPGKKVVSIQSGEWTSSYEGKGYEPLGYRDFEIGDDPRRINLPATARRGVPTIVNRVALRDFKVMVVLDRSASMRIRDKFEIQLTAVALLLYSAWKSETTFGFAVSINEELRTMGLGVGSRHFYNLYRELWTLFSNPEARVKGTRVALSRYLPPNTMVLYCSDFLTSDGALIDVSRLWKSVHRYDFIPVIIQDELEYSFPVFSKGTFVPFSNPENGGQGEVWISPVQSHAIESAHKSRFEELTNKWEFRGAKCLHLGILEAKIIRKQIDRFFAKRKKTTTS